MIKPLPYKKVSAIIEEIFTSGHSPLKVLTDDYDMYIVKSSQGKFPDFYLISEFLCSYFLNLWEIKTPDIAAITLPISLLKSSLTKKHKSHFYENKICFGSKFMNVTDLNQFLNNGHHKFVKKFHKADDLLKIALFDIWVENDDRKPSNNNLILVTENGKQNFVAIDNAYCFNSLNYENLNPKYGITNTYNESILNTMLSKGIYQTVKGQENWVAYMKTYFYICIEKCSQYFDLIVQNIPQDLGFDNTFQMKIRNFLFNEERNKVVFDEFITRLNFKIEQ
jgi:hypothetical protein